MSLPETAQPARAGKRASDVGVLGLEATKNALNLKYGPPVPTPVTGLTKDGDDFTASNWGKETPEEKERKAKMVREARARQMDLYAMARRVIFVVARMFLIQKIFRSMSSAYLGESTAKNLIWAALALYSWQKWGAKSRVNPNLKAPVMRLPIIGSLLPMALQKHRFHNYLFESLASIGFQTSEICIPGNHFIAVMDARDREYVLKTNFRNYLKNRENDMGSFEYVLGDVTGRGIFSTDKIEWQDSRKIASHMFSGASLKAKMEDVFNRHADEVVHILETRVAGTGKSIDMVCEPFLCQRFLKLTVDDL